MRPRALWPWMVAATVLVMVLPAAAVWALSAAGILTTLWAAVAVSAGLSLAATAAGSAYWRRHATGDVLFSDLPLWGWLRRRRMQHRLARADQLLAVAATAPPERTATLLAELGAALDAEDPYLDGHSRRVARYATMTARRMHLPEEQVQRIKTAAAVHDIGKLRVPDAIVHSPGRLTSEEYEQIKRHAPEGAALIDRVGDPALTAAVRAHHERFDGSGYPDGLAGERIPLEARIISVADTFDSITSPRAYRRPTPHAKALHVVADEAGRQLDPDATRAFISCYSGRRAGALWASLAALPRQLAGRLSITPAELTAAATTALSVPLIVVAGATAAAALPDTAADPSTAGAALSQPAATPPADPTAGEPAGSAGPAPTPEGAATAATPAASAAPGSPTPAPAPGTASEAATATPPPPPAPEPSPGTPSAAAAPVATPTFYALPLPPPFPAATPEPPQPTATPAPTAGPPDPAPTAGPPDPEPTISPPFPTPTATATPRPPHTADDCRNGGWEDLGYPDQGECIADAT